MLTLVRAGLSLMALKPLVLSATLSAVVSSPSLINRSDWYRHVISQTHAAQGGCSRCILNHVPISQRDHLLSWDSRSSTHSLSSMVRALHAQIRMTREICRVAGQGLKRSSSTLPVPEMSSREQASPPRQPPDSWILPGKAIASLPSKRN